MKDKGMLDRIIDFMAFLAGILLVGAVLVVCWEIAMRYFVHRPLVWAVEVCEYILFSIAFLGAPWLLKKGGHVSVDIVIEHLGPKIRQRMRLLAMASGIIISVIISWFGLTTAWECYKTGVLVTKTLNVPKHYFMILIFIGYLFLMLEFARQFIRHFKEPRDKD